MMGSIFVFPVLNLSQRHTKKDTDLIIQIAAKVSEQGAIKQAIETFKNVLLVNIFASRQ